MAKMCETGRVHLISNAKSASAVNGAAPRTRPRPLRPPLLHTGLGASVSQIERIHTNQWWNNQLERQLIHYYSTENQRATMVLTSLR